MISSRAQQEDKQFRVSLLKSAGEFLTLHEQYSRPFYLEIAEEIYAICELLKAKIASHDYSFEDQVRARTDEFNRLVQARIDAGSNLSDKSS